AGGVALDLDDLAVADIDELGTADGAVGTDRVGDGVGLVDPGLERRAARRLHRAPAPEPVARAQLPEHRPGERAAHGSLIPPPASCSSSYPTAATAAPTQRSRHDASAAIRIRNELQTIAKSRMVESTIEPALTARPGPPAAVAAPPSAVAARMPPPRISNSPRARRREWRNVGRSVYGTPQIWLRALSE